MVTSLIGVTLKARIFGKLENVFGEVCTVWVEDGNVLALLVDNDTMGLVKVELNGAECMSRGAYNALKEGGGDLLSPLQYPV